MTINSVIRFIIHVIMTIINIILTLYVFFTAKLAIKICTEKCK